jgi:uncharacterized protein YlxW (UPF0749 family)
VPNTDAWLALAGTVFGGVGLKAVEAYLGRTKHRDDTAASLRTELRVENSELRLEIHRLMEENRELEAALDQWREKYFDLLAQVKTKE